MRSILLGSAMVVVLAAGALVAQPMGRGGRGGCAGACGAQAMRFFDVKTIETIDGDLAKLETLPGRGRGGARGVHAWVKSAGGEIEVHLGPAWFIENQELRLAAGDRVQVRGSCVTIDGAVAIIAIEVKRGEDVLKLRDESGVPVWAAWRAGPKS